MGKNKAKENTETLKKRQEGPRNTIKGETNMKKWKQKDRNERIGETKGVDREKRSLPSTLHYK